MTGHSRAISTSFKRAVLLAAVIPIIWLIQSGTNISEAHGFGASSGHFAFQITGDEALRGQKAEAHSTDPWTEDQLVRPEDLAKQISGDQKPVVLQIGVAFLFQSAHIPGSRYVGPASKTEGVEELKKAVAGPSAEPQNRAVLWLLPMEGLSEYPTGF